MRFYIAILVSLAIHILLNLGLIWAPLPQPPGHRSVIEVDLPDSNSHKTKDRQKQIVRDSMLPEQLKKMDDETLAHYLSAQRQRVEKETKAAENGMTANRAEAQDKNTKKSQNPGHDKKLPSATDLVKDELDPEAVTTGRNKRKNIEPPLSNPQSVDLAHALQPGRSTVGESLPEEMSIGSFTALNTDRFTYYTFYARVEELVRFRWESKVRQALETLDHSRQIDQVRGKNWITQYEFWLEPTGRLHSAHLLKESGVRRFDFAAEFAFRDALIFPNPPKDLIDEDGFIKLRYTFNVFWNGY